MNTKPKGEANKFRKQSLMASSVVVGQYLTKTPVQFENFDDENIVTSSANNGKKECNGTPKDTSPALPGWYADVSWPGNSL